MTTGRCFLFAVCCTSPKGHDGPEVQPIDPCLVKGGEEPIGGELVVLQR